MLAMWTRALARSPCRGPGVGKAGVLNLCRARSDVPLLPSMQRVRVPVRDDLTLHAVQRKTRLEHPRTPAPILCLPGAFGSVLHNFRPQFAGLGDEFEMAGLDLRGYGYSQPPARDFPPHYFERDADDVIRAIDAMGYDKVSILGWSAGANTGAVVAAKFPARVDRLVLINANSFVDKEDIEIFNKYENISTWHPAARHEGEVVYGAEAFQQGWSAMIARLRQIYAEEGGELYTARLPDIRCKTLVVTGGRDMIVPKYHGEYLTERILHGRHQIFPQGRHDVNVQLADEVNEALRTFWTEPDDKDTQSREKVARPV